MPARRTLGLIILAVLLAGCGSALPKDYDVREGDILFQSLPHGR